MTFSIPFGEVFQKLKAVAAAFLWVKNRRYEVIIGDGPSKFARNLLRRSK
jgi:hypothetical protein